MFHATCCFWKDLVHQHPRQVGIQRPVKDLQILFCELCCESILMTGNTYGELGYSHNPPHFRFSLAWFSQRKHRNQVNS